MRCNGGYRSRWLLGVIFCVGVGGMNGSVLGLNIVLTFNSGNSQNPEFDPDGAGLISIMQAVEDIYEDIIKDSHTLRISYWWDDLSSSTLGVHQPIQRIGERETLANLRFDTATSSGSDRLWFIDPTPMDDSEFAMSQKLFDDLSSQGSFSGSVPGQFEVGYRGLDIPSAPSDARNGFDLLTVALHEVGHGLGVPAANPANNETDDGDFDFPPDFLGGLNAAVDIAGTDTQGKFHVKPSEALMNPSVSTGLREYPSATDIFAMASTAGWTQIDLPRKDFLGSGDPDTNDWNTPANWIGNRVPDSEDDIYIRHGGSTTGAGAQEDHAPVSLGADASVLNLTVSNGSELRSAQYQLLVVEQLLIEQGSRLVVGDLDFDLTAPVEDHGIGTDTLSFGGGVNELVLAGATLTVVNDGVTIDSDDSLTGSGKIIAPVASEGLIAPGPPPGSPGSSGFSGTLGVIEIEGGLGLLEGGRVEIGIGSMGHDRVVIDGLVTLGGTLVIELEDQFIPEFGNTFDIMIAQLLTEDFGTIEGDVFRINETQTALVPVINHELGMVTLVTTAVGDANHDGTVDFLDFLLLQNVFDEPGDWYNGDFTGDGMVSFEDFLLLQNNFDEVFFEDLGHLAAVASFIAEVSGVVPEPGTGMLFCGLMTLGWSRRRTRSLAI